MGLLETITVNVLAADAIYGIGRTGIGGVASRLGFRSAGIAAGSLAAAAQSYSGNLVAGSSKSTAIPMPAPTPKEQKK